MTNEELDYIKEYKRWPTPITDSIIINKNYYLLAILLLFIGWEYFSFSNLMGLLLDSAIFIVLLVALILNVLEYKSDYQFESISIKDIQIDTIFKVLSKLKWNIVTHQDSYVRARANWGFLTSSQEITIVLMENEILMNSIANSAKQRNKYKRAELFDQFKMALERELNTKN